MKGHNKTPTINTGDSLPIKQAPGRMPVHMQKEVDRHIDDLLQQHIKPSSNPWASNVILNDTTIFCFGVQVA